MTNWNQSIIDEYRANGGKVGGYFANTPLLLLHTIGAKTGQARESPVAFFRQDDGSMVVVASKQGMPTNPAWYHNLKANPRFDVEVGTDTLPVVAEEITGPEYTTKWAEIVAKYSEEPASKVNGGSLGDVSNTGNTNHRQRSTHRR